MTDAPPLADVEIAALRALHGKQPTDATDIKLQRHGGGLRGLEQRDPPLVRNDVKANEGRRFWFLTDAGEAALEDLERQ